MQYAKQRELISNLDKKLDYHNLQKARHPYINELRSYMKDKRSSVHDPEITKMNTPHDYARKEDDFLAK